MIVFRKRKKDLSKKEINSLARKALKKHWWSWAIVPLLGVILGIVGLLFGEDAEDTTMAISLIIASPICLCLFYFLFRYIFCLTVKNNSRLVAGGATYEFDDTGLKATEIGINIKMVSEINFQYYKKVVETENSYLFYAQNNGVFAIEKSDLESGSLDEFNLILITSYGENFKPFRKKI